MTNKTSFSLKATSGRTTLIETFEVFGETVRIFTRGLSKANPLPDAYVSKEEARKIWKEMTQNGWERV